MDAAYPLDPLVQVMKELRGPQGCPWDKEQTHDTLKRYLIEETYEVIEAIEMADMEKLREELGDLLLQIVFHAQLASEKQAFDMNDVVASIVRKMRARHPHVFGEQKVETAAQVLDNWEKIKDREKAEAGHRQTLMDVPRDCRLCSAPRKSKPGRPGSVLTGPICGALGKKFRRNKGSCWRLWPREKPGPFGMNSGIYCLPW